MSVHLYRLARWCIRRRWAVLAAWIVIAIAMVVLATALGGKTDDNLGIPGTEADHAAQVLAAKLPALAGGSTQVVFATTGADITKAPYSTGVEAAVANLRKVGQVAAVTDPFITRSISPDGHVALADVQFRVAAPNVAPANVTAVQTATAPARAAGVEVEYAGSVSPTPPPALSELPETIGIVVAFLILLVAFGAFGAALLPMVAAIIGVITTLMALTAIAAAISVASASTTVALMLGLSCGIDYGLFIVSRHRSNLLAGGMTVEESAARAAGTAGSSVVFAALTVIVALCALAIPGIPFLTTMGLAAAGSVFIALLISLTLTPAVIGIAGRRVAKFITRSTERRALAAVRNPDRTHGARWSRFVVRHRIPVVIGGLVLLGVVAFPATTMHLGLPDAGSQPTSTTARRAYDLTSEHFGPGFNGVLLVVAEDVHTPAQAARISKALAALPDVATADQAAVASDTAVFDVVPRTSPDDPATGALVNRIRDNRASIAGSTDTRILVGGLTAANIDISAKLASALPIFLVVVILLALLLLTFAFRTILVPIKSIIGFLLSVSASFGALVAFFQWGWGRQLLGVTPGPIVSFLPIILLAIVFGLSSDYEMFVVSRIKEDYTKTGDARGAVERGTGNSARVVTAAALVMVSIFVAFMTADDPTIKSIGFSFAIGVFIDAFVVRLTLVPAVLAIVGKRMWYHPRWFARHVPDPDIEGERLRRDLTERAPVEVQVGSG
jgi:putative drug exporter of the RND superfamily